MAKKSKPSKHQRSTKKQGAVLPLLTQPSEQLEQQAARPQMGPSGETLQSKLWRFSDSNLFWGGGGAVALAAYAFMFSTAPALLPLILLFIAWVVIAISVFRHNFFEGKKRFAAWIGNVTCSLIVAAIIGAGWYALRPKPSPNQSKLSTAAPVSKSLRDLYESDFRSTSRPAIVGRPVTFTLSSHPEKPIVCDNKIIVDIETKTRIVAYYIPITAFTREVCEVILGDYQKRLADWDEYGISLHPEGERPNELRRFKDAAFTGQIYIYHESLLYQPDLDELSVIYRQHGLDPHFRGINYAVTKNKQTNNR